MEETNRSMDLDDDKKSIEEMLKEIGAFPTTPVNVSDDDFLEDDDEVSAGSTDEPIASDEALTVSAEEVPVRSARTFSLRDAITKVRVWVRSRDFYPMLLRLITAYFVVSGIMALVMDGRKIDPIHQWRDFVQATSFGWIVVLVLAMTAVLTGVNALIPRRYRVVDPLLTIGAVLFFDMVILWQVNNLYLTIGVMIVSLVLIGYALSKLRTHRWFHKVPWWVYGLVGVAMAALTATFISIGTIHRHYVFGTGAHDFGLFVQMYHSLADNLTAITSCERDELMSHFSIHASYIFYALVPIFKLFPYEETLLIAQAVLAMGGVVPLILIAKRRGFQGLSLLGVAMAYAFCVALISPCFYDFHENAFLPTLLMWLLWAVDGRKVVPFYLFSALACIVKEDVSLFVICIGLYWFIEHKGTRMRWHGLVGAVLSGTYMMLITDYLSKHGDGQMMTNSRFGHLLLSPEGGFAQVVVNSVSDPAYFFSLFIKESTLLFFLQIMLPLLFLPFFTKKLHRYWLMVPFIITNLVIGANYGHAAQVDYQYVFGPVTMLLYLTLVNVTELTPRMRRSVPVLLGAAALIFATGTVSHRIDYVDQYEARAKYYLQLEGALDLIPQDATVGADAFYIPHICDHKEVYIFDFGDLTDDKTALREPERYDYIALPTNSDVHREAAKVIKKSGFAEWVRIEGMVIYKQSQ